jgi:uncharacterized protein (TIRG00374 family)
MRIDDEREWELLAVDVPSNPEADDAGVATPRWRSPALVGRTILSVAIIVAVFVWVLPRVMGADYQAVFSEMRLLPARELVLLTAVWLASLWIYAFALRACLRDLTHPQAQVLNLTGSAVSNVAPFGGAVGIGVTYNMARSWGYTRSEISVEILVTGVFNVLTKLALPVIALAGLTMAGRANASATAAAVTGLMIFALIVAFFVVIERSERATAKLGTAVDGVWAATARRFGRDHPATVTKQLLDFRHATFTLVKRKWPVLTAALIGFKFSQFVLLYLCLHAVDPHTHLGPVEVFAAYALGRVLSTIPITPAGVGIVETGSIAALTALGGAGVACAAGVLLFSGFIYLLEIPLGGVTGLIWWRRRSWRGSHQQIDPTATDTDASLVAPGT